jgi:phosphoribosylanthranilate isomerase
MAVRVKICGITRHEDLRAACEAGADALGFVFYANSPRNLAIGQAAALVARMPPFIQSVGLFVNADPDFVRAVLKAVPLDLLQFHGDERPDVCRAFGRPYLKAVRVRVGVDLVKYAADFSDARALLLDAFVPGVPGGTGERFDWSLIPPGLPKPVVLSGGLNPDNVAEAVGTVHPWAVDVSSGVESAPGIKDAAKVVAFVRNARTDCTSPSPAGRGGLKDKHEP